MGSIMKAANEQRVSLREVNQHLTQYVKAVEAGERIVITRRGKPVALLSPVPTEERRLSAEQEAALVRLLSQTLHLGGVAPEAIPEEPRAVGDPRGLLRGAEVVGLYAHQCPPGRPKGTERPRGGQRTS